MTRQSNIIRDSELQVYLNNLINSKTPLVVFLYREKSKFEWNCWRFTYKIQILRTPIEWNSLIIDQKKRRRNKIIWIKRWGGRKSIPERVIDGEEEEEEEESRELTLLVFPSNTSHEAIRFLLLFSRENLCMCREINFCKSLYY